MASVCLFCIQYIFGERIFSGFADTQSLQKLCSTKYELAKKKCPNPHAEKKIIHFISNRTDSFLMFNLKSNFLLICLCNYFYYFVSCFKVWYVLSNIIISEI